MLDCPLGVAGAGVVGAGVVVEPGVDGVVVESGVDGVVVEPGDDGVVVESGVVGVEFGVVGVGVPGDDGVNGAEESGAVGAAGVVGLVVLGAAGVVGVAFGVEGVVESGVVLGAVLLGADGDVSFGELVFAGFEGEPEGVLPGTARPGASVLGDCGVDDGAEVPYCASGLSGDIAWAAINGDEVGAEIGLGFAGFGLATEGTV